MIRSAVIVVLLALVVVADAQPQSNSLTNCLADNTTGRDRKDLARWIFLSIAAHPEIKQYTSANVSTAVDQSARTMAALVTRLLAESCTKEIKAAGDLGKSLDLAFRNLGELAMQELMTEAAVKETMSLFGKYLDQERLDKLRAQN